MVVATVPGQTASLGSVPHAVTDMPVRCRAWPEGADLRASIHDYVELVDKLDAALDGSVRLSLNEMASGHALAACSGDRSQLLVRIEAVIPGLDVQAVPLYPLRVLPTALSESLSSASGRHNAQTGYLTLEQSRRLVLLEERDPKASEVPLVGIWVTGVASISSPYVWAAATRFARLAPPAAQTVKTQDGVGAFLCLVYPSAVSTTVSPGGFLSASGPVPPPIMFELQPQSEPCSTLRLVGATMQVQLPPPAPSSLGDDAVLFETSAAEAPALSRLISQRYPSAPRTNAAIAAAAATLNAACQRLLAASLPQTQPPASHIASPPSGTNHSPRLPTATSVYRSSAPERQPDQPYNACTPTAMPPVPPSLPPSLRAKCGTAQDAFAANPASYTDSCMDNSRPMTESTSKENVGGRTPDPQVDEQRQGSAASQASPLASLVVDLQRQLTGLLARVEQQSRDSARMSEKISRLEVALAESEAARAVAVTEAALAARRLPNEGGREPKEASGAELRCADDGIPTASAAIKANLAPLALVQPDDWPDGKSSDENASIDGRNSCESADGIGGDENETAFWGDDIYDEIPRIEYVPDDNLSDDEDEVEDEGLACAESMIHAGDLIDGGEEEGCEGSSSEEEINAGAAEKFDE